MEISLEKQKSIFRILKEGGYVYGKNFFLYTKVLIFPIVAHLIGIPYVVMAGFIVPELFPIEFAVRNISLVVAVTFIATIPGFLLFLKGFWAYLIAMVSLNRYTEGLIIEDNGITTKSCAEYVILRQKTYIYVLCIMMLLWIAGFLISLLPALLGFVLPSWVVILLMIITWVVAMILVLCLSVYFSLCFQVFAFEEIDVIDIFKRSFSLIDNNFLRTLIMIVILYIITGILFPFIAHTVLDITGIVSVLTYQIEGFVENIVNYLNNSSILFDDPITKGVNSFLAFFKDPVKEVSKLIIISTIDGIVTAGMLPLGTICFTLLYFDIKTRKAHKD